MGSRRGFGTALSTEGRVSAPVFGKAFLWAITAGLATTIVFETVGVSILVIATLHAGDRLKRGLFGDSGPLFRPLSGWWECNCFWSFSWASSG